MLKSQRKFFICVKIWVFIVVLGFLVGYISDVAVMSDSIVDEQTNLSLLFGAIGMVLASVIAPAAVYINEQNVT
jgi:uncharacterized membrane protein (DUF485 family)